MKHRGPNMKRAIFLDKDGTLIQDVPYNVNPKKIFFLPAVIDGLHRLQKLGYALIVISNQSGIAKGIFTVNEFNKVKNKIIHLLNSYSIQLAGFYICPHHPEGKIKKYAKECHCRKPHTGLIERAVEELQINLQHSWFIGDILHDIEVGNSSNCRTILLANSNETEWKIEKNSIPHYIATSFIDAVNFIELGRKL